MKTIFSCVLGALLIAACCAQTVKDTYTDRFFQQAINYLNIQIPKENSLKEKVFLHSPTNDIKECCSQSAIECFKIQLTSAFYTNKLMMKVARNLSKSSMMKSMTTCTTEEIKQAQCMSCKTYPKVSSKDFLMNLQSHLQKAYSRFS